MHSHVKWSLCIRCCSTLLNIVTLTRTHLQRLHIFPDKSYSFTQRHHHCAHRSSAINSRARDSSAWSRSLWSPALCCAKARMSLAAVALFHHIVIITVLAGPLQSIVERDTLPAGQEVCGLLHCAAQKQGCHLRPSHFFITLATAHALRSSWDETSGPFTRYVLFESFVLICLASSHCYHHCPRWFSAINSRARDSFSRSRCLWPPALICAKARMSLAAIALVHHIGHSTRALVKLG